LVTFSREQARFSQKRLKELFEDAFAKFDPEAFYAVREVAAA